MQSELSHRAFDGILARETDEIAREANCVVMAGLVPAIHDFQFKKQDVDAPRRARA